MELSISMKRILTQALGLSNAPRPLFNFYLSASPYETELCRMMVKLGLLIEASGTGMIEKTFVVTHVAARLLGHELP